MQDETDRAYARFCAQRRPEDLSQVFDATSPRLLRVAVHLVGDAAAAEDLVQATFLTAIERASSFEPGRAVEPWLTGILTRHAHALRREARREVDLARLIERAPETPLEEASSRERDSEVARVLDRLPEPYRATLLLRVRHGMNAADIAHVLDTSPGAVRVRIHRGLDLLRRQLPAGIALGALFALEPARGLAAIRVQVLAEVGKPAVAGSALVAAGGVLVGKKLAWLAAIVLLLALGGWRGIRGLAPRDRQPPPGGPPDTRVAAVPIGSVEPELVDTLGSQPPPVPRVAAAEGVAEHALSGRVVDGLTGAPIAGAEIAVHAPVRTTRAALMRRYGDRILQTNLGTLVCLDVWPALPETWPEGAMLGEQELEVADVVEGARPAATATSSADGTFALTTPVLGGLLACAAEGYAERRLPAVGGEQRIRLWKVERLSGRILDRQGRPIERRIRLAFDGITLPEPGARGWEPRFSGSRSATTGPDGRFEVELAAERVTVRSLDPGWVPSDGVHPDTGEKAFQTSFRPGRESGPALVFLEPVTSLRVRDARDGRAIERFALSASGGAQGMRYLWHGVYDAPGGELALIEGFGGLNDQRREHYAGRFELTVWSDAHRPRTVAVESLLDEREVLVELEPGAPDALDGRVVRAGNPQAELPLALLPIEALGRELPGDGWLLAYGTTATDGTFALGAAPGEYALRVGTGEAARCFAVRVPSRGVELELSVSARLVLRLLDRDGNPCADRSLTIVDEEHPTRLAIDARTDGRGEARLEPFEPGRYSVEATHRVQGRDLRVGPKQPFSVATGDDALVVVESPAGRPRHARIVADGVDRYRGWRASAAFGEEPVWTDVDADGRVPIDVQLGVHALTIEDEQGARWHVPLPRDPPDGHEIRIARTGLELAGVVVDARTGEPIRGVRVTARARGDGAGTPEVGVVADDGRFRLRDLQDVEHVLVLTGPGDWPYRSSFREASFLPRARPSLDAEPIEIGVPWLAGSVLDALPSVAVSGRVRVAGAGRAGLRFSVSACFPQPDGELLVRTAGVGGPTGEGGRFEARAPVAPRYSIDVTDPVARTRWPTVEWAAEAGADEQTRDIDLP